MVGVKGFSDKDLGEDAGCCLGSYQIPAFTNTAQYHSWMISFEKLNTVGTIYGEGGITGERYNVTITKIIKTYRLSYTVHASDSFGEP